MRNHEPHADRAPTHTGSSELERTSPLRTQRSLGDSALRASLAGSDPFSRTLRAEVRAARFGIPGPLDSIEETQGALSGDVLDRPGQGEPLPELLRERFEGALGHDLSHVRIHRSAADAEAASELSARAFAMGSDLFFGAGEFAPETPGGDKLLAHELTHVVQHDEGRLPSGGGVSSPSDPVEQEARAAEDRVTSRLQPAQELRDAARALGSDLFESGDVELEADNDAELSGIQDLLEQPGEEEQDSSLDAVRDRLDEARRALEDSKVGPEGSLEEAHAEALDRLADRLDEGEDDLGEQPEVGLPGSEALSQVEDSAGSLLGSLDTLIRDAGRGTLEVEDVGAALDGVEMDLEASATSWVDEAEATLRKGLGGAKDEPAPPEPESPIPDESPGPDLLP